MADKLADNGTLSAIFISGRSENLAIRALQALRSGKNGAYPLPLTPERTYTCSETTLSVFQVRPLNIVVAENMDALRLVAAKQGVSKRILGQMLLAANSHVPQHDPHRVSVPADLSWAAQQPAGSAADKRLAVGPWTFNQISN
jgi:hypothetical protein